MLLKETKTNYLIFIVGAFLVTLVTYVLVYKGNAFEVIGNFMLALVFYALLLSFIFLLVKLFFHFNARTKNDELKLEDLPKDQEDIRRTH